MRAVTRILSQIESGDPSAAEQLLPLVYDELRRLAVARLQQERPGNTLQPTALVHEAYLRLVSPEDDFAWSSKAQFFAAAAEAMRRILIDRARNKRRLKRGGGHHRVDFEKIQLAIDTGSEDLLELDAALEELESAYEDCAALVKLRFFAGMQLGEAARCLGISRSTADRRWAFARAWLRVKLSGEPRSADEPVGELPDEEASGGDRSAGDPSAGDSSAGQANTGDESS